MPAAWDDSLDSVRVYDGPVSFVGGQYSYAKARLLQDNQASLLQDAEVAVTGQISNRFGTSELGSDVGSGSSIDLVDFFNAPGNIYEVSISNGTIYQLNGSTWTPIGTLSTPELPTIAQGSDKLFFAAGGDVYQWDGSTLTDLSGDGGSQAPLGVSILRWHTNRLVAAGPSIRSFSTDTNAVSDAMYFSDFLSPATWGNAKIATQIRVGGGEGTAITTFVPWTNFNIAVLKRRSVYVVTADPTLDISDFPITRVHPTVGCVGRRTGVQVGSDIFFLSDDGIRSLTQVQASDQQFELQLPLSYPVQDIIDRINWVAATKACAVFWRGRYIIALPLDGSSTNNYILVYNTITKSWQGIWTNLPVSSFGVREVSGVPHLMMGLATDKKVIEYLDFTNPSNWTDDTFRDYNGVSTQLRGITKAFMFGEPVAQKVGMGGQVEWNNSKGSIVVTPILDEVSKTPFTIAIPSGGFAIPFTPPFTIATQGLSRKTFDMIQYGEFRELQFDFITTGDGRKEIRQIPLAAIVRPTLVGDS